MRKLWAVLPSLTVRTWRNLGLAGMLIATWLGLRERISLSLSDPEFICVATRDGMQGVVTSNGNVVVPFVWDEIRSFDGNGFAVVGTSPLGKAAPFGTKSFGLIDRRGNTVIPARCSMLVRTDDDSVPFHAVDGGALVGFDDQGNRVFESPVHPLSYLQFDSHGLLPGQRGTDVGWFDESGKLVVRVPEHLMPWSQFNEQGLAAVRSSSGKVGCINLKGKPVIQAEWDLVLMDVPRGRQNSGGGFIEVTRGELYGLFDVAGTQILPPEFKSISIDTNRRLFMLENQHENYGCLDFDGNEVIPFDWDFLSSFDDHGMALAERAGQQCWMNEKAEVVLDVDSEPVEGEKPRFDSFGMALVRRNEKWGWITRDGTEVIPPQFDIARSFDARGLAIVATAGKYGAIDRAGAEIIPFQYSGLSDNRPWSELLTAELDDHLGLIDRQNQVVVPFEHAWPLSFDRDGMAIASRDGQYQILDAEGRRIGPTSDRELSRLDHEYSHEEMKAFIAIKSKSELKHIIPLAGKVFKAEEEGGLEGVFATEHGLIIPPIYEEVVSTSFGFRGVREREGILYNASESLRERCPVLMKWFAKTFPWHHAYLAQTQPLEVLYDLNGKEFWRGDNRWRDLTRSYWSGSVGAFCLFRSWRRSKAERRLHARKPAA